MTEFIYGSGWNDEIKIMLDPMSEEEARARYEKGLEVSIACGEEPLTPDDPDDYALEGEEPAVWTLYTELSRSERRPEQPDVAIVEFFDFWGTRVASYFFYRQDDGRLFLLQVNEYEFADATRFVDGNEWSVLTEHHFQQDGYSSVTVRTATPGGGQDVSMTEHRGGDFSAHWEPVPAWGDWASITRRDRSQPA